MEKTTLAVQLVKQISNNFEFVIWKNLNIPSKPISLAELLTNWLEILDNYIHTPDSLANKIDRFIKYLQNQRCLLILDNFESIMQLGCLGSYCTEYEEYGVILRQILQSEHQSCLLITSRENPNIPYPEQQFFRYYKLSGLDVSEVKKIFTLTDTFTASELEWQEIQKYYAGNPLLLKHIASFVQEIYNCNIAQFINEYLQYDLLREIQEVIEVQLSRLSNFEKEIVYWLAINQRTFNDR
ncbi:MAG: hypothetical protein HC908_12175 [Calothrix sp. SM1_7_51]|nr:hypothetical protein [Calothrix sp. SM1_7_51]